MPLAPYKAKLIEGLLASNVLLIGSYPLKSKRESPYFLKLDAVDDGQGLLSLSEAYADAILGNFSQDSFDGLVGIPQKCHVFGPPVAVELARRGVNRKYSSWRDKPKTYGDASGVADEYEQRQKERVLGAKLPRGSRQVLIDD